MRRPRPALPTRLLAIVIAFTTVVAIGCSRADADADADGADGEAEAAAPTDTTSPATTVAATPPTTAALPLTDPAACDDEPAVTVPPGEQPLTVVRPCTIPDDLRIFVVHEGRGRSAQNGDTLIVDYTGIRASDGQMFDMSYLRGVPMDFVLGRGSVILGWDIGLLGARPGEVVRLDVPGDQAYGDSPPSAEIPPGEALTFLVEVRAVIPPVTADDAPLDLLVDPSEGATDVTWVDTTTGDGAAVTPGSTAVVHVLLVRGDNLKVLLSTWERSDPLQIVMADGETLPGIVTGLQGATVGTTRVITMPAAEAFGPDGEPGLGLPAGVDLIVVAQVMGVY